MTPAARVQAAVEVLDTVLSGTPAERALAGWARRARFAGSADRAAIRDHVFQALRRRRSFAALGGAMRGRSLMIGALRDADEDPETLFSGAGYGPAPLSPEEAQRGSCSMQDLWDLPDWLIARFDAALGPQAAAAAQALRDRAPVMLRTNHRKTRVAEAIAALAEDGIVARADPVAHGALVVEAGARKLARSRAYLDGRVEIQDGASQAAMACLDITPGARVLDYCSGGGGKTLALAARAEAEWFAHDVDPARMADLPARAARADVRVTQLTAEALAVSGPFDLILCDAPCSGSGTWRRTPEMKWALTADRLAGMTALQGEILARAAPLVASGGLLAYATCSVLTEENEQPVANFLETHSGWRAEASRRWPICDSGDGFFLALLRRDTG